MYNPKKNHDMLTGITNVCCKTKHENKYIEFVLTADLISGI